VKTYGPPGAYCLGDSSPCPWRKEAGTKATLAGTQSAAVQHQREHPGHTVEVSVEQLLTYYPEPTA
jgi:hypothetical protein